MCFDGKRLCGLYMTERLGYFQVISFFIQKMPLDCQKFQFQSSVKVGDFSYVVSKRNLA